MAVMARNRGPSTALEGGTGGQAGRQRVVNGSVNLRQEGRGRGGGTYLRAGGRAGGQVQDRTELCYEYSSVLYPTEMSRGKESIPTIGVSGSQGGTVKWPRESGRTE